MLAFGVVVLGVTDRARAEEFWCAALGYRVRNGAYQISRSFFHLRMNLHCAGLLIRWSILRKMRGLSG